MTRQTDEEIQRKLANVDEAAHRGGLRDMRHEPLKWLVGAACAVAAALLVVFILDANKPHPRGPIPAKPVIIEIVPLPHKQL